MRTATSLGVLLGVTLCALLLCSATLPLQADCSAPIRIVITRDLRGYLKPCDCKAGVLGGFPRRTTLLDQTIPDLLLDAGDTVALASPYDNLRFSFMLELCAELGYDAITLGRREVGFSSEEITRLAKKSKVPLISGNVAGADGTLLLRSMKSWILGRQRKAYRHCMREFWVKQGFSSRIGECAYVHAISGV